jgi:hypothetical protein
MPLLARLVVNNSKRGSASLGEAKRAGAGPAPATPSTALATASAATSSSERDRAERDLRRLQWFTARVEQLSEARSFSVGEREAILYSIFYELQHCRHALQLEVLEVFCALLERRPAALLGGTGVSTTLLHLVVHTIELTALSRTISNEMRTGT